VLNQPWHLSHRADAAVIPIADRHYNRQKIGAPQFVPPGRCLVLKIGDRDQLWTPDAGGAFWVTSWPFAEYVRHAWPGAWMCSAFRNEGAGLSSELITAAVAATVANWRDVPPLGMVTFVDREKTRRKRDPGRCYRRAGFEPCGETKGGLVALQLTPERMPDPVLAIGQQSQTFSLFGMSPSAPLPLNRHALSGGAGAEGGAA
jgi:hypothetical protein